LLFPLSKHDDLPPALVRVLLWQKSGAAKVFGGDAQPLNASLALLQRRHLPTLYVTGGVRALVINACGSYYSAVVCHCAKLCINADSMLRVTNKTSTAWSASLRLSYPNFAVATSRALHP
jgi:hypothetical protein